MKFILALLFAFPGVVHGQCFPTNNKWYPATLASGVSKTQFSKAISLVKNYYAPIVKSQGYELRINSLWADGTVNAQAYRQGRVWHVDAFGGMARHPRMNMEGFLLVMCHEVGHHLGGKPRYNRNTDWASVEGQSDYWAAVACMRNVAPSAILLGAQSLGKVLADLGGEPDPSFNTPDLSVVPITMESHPPAQCRVDTYLAGSKGKARPRCWFAP